MKIPYFIVPLMVGVIIQLIKIVIDFSIEKTINLEHLWRAGGFPSVHSGISGSICFLAFWVLGYDSMWFAICITFATLFWYDAMNVRYEAGQHAKYLNTLRIEISDLTKFSQNYKLLKERLGHTIQEVSGGVLIWVLLSYLVIILLGIKWINW